MLISSYKRRTQKGTKMRRKKNMKPPLRRKHTAYLRGLLLYDKQRIIYYYYILKTENSGIYFDRFV